MPTSRRAALGHCGPDDGWHREAGSPGGGNAAQERATRDRHEVSFPNCPTFQVDVGAYWTWRMSHVYSPDSYFLFLCAATTRWVGIGTERAKRTAVWEDMVNIGATNLQALVRDIFQREGCAEAEGERIGLLSRCRQSHRPRQPWRDPRSPLRRPGCATARSSPTGRPRSSPRATPSR